LAFVDEFDHDFEIAQYRARTVGRKLLDSEELQAGRGEPLQPTLWVEQCNPPIALIGHSRLLALRNGTPRQI